MRLRLALLASLTLSSPAFSQVRLHVRADAPQGGDGLSWNSAFTNIDDALAITSPGTQYRVWVAAGHYTPQTQTDPFDPRTATYAPVPGLRLLGGFDGTELLFSERAGLFSTTILDGDLGAVGDPSDNSYNVIQLLGNGAHHTVDGFTIRNGNANGPPGTTRRGGGISSQLGTKSVLNCTFENNQGIAGGALNSMASLTTIESCTFRSNSSPMNGGALWASGTLRSINNLFVRNFCSERGGAIYASQGSNDTAGVPITRFQNNIFTDNRANRGGAAFISDPSGPVSAGKAVFSGCTFYLNVATITGAVINTSASFSASLEVRIHNSILWNNRAPANNTLGGDPGHFVDVSYSIIQGGWPGLGIQTNRPSFVDPYLRDLRLSPNSPAIDAGDNNQILRDISDLNGNMDELEGTPFDFAGSPRRVDDPVTADTGIGTAPVVDLGAHEFPG